MKAMLNPAATWSLSKNKLKVMIDRQSFVFEINPIPGYKLINGIEVTPSDLGVTQIVFDMMIKSNIIIDYYANQHINTRYEKTNDFFMSKANRYSPNGINEIRSKHVIIVGCGGTGSLIAKHLAAVGIGELTLVDFDLVQVTNLNRQYIFNPADLGKKKTESLKQHIYNFNQDTKINAVEMLIGDDFCLSNIQAFHSADLIICAADTPFLKIQRYLTTDSIALDIPILFGGVGLDKGRIGPLLITEPGKYNYIKIIELAMNDLPKFATILSSSYGPTNSIVSAYLSDLAIRFLTIRFSEDVPSKYVDLLL